MKKLNSILFIFSMVFMLISSESFAQCSVNAGSDATVYAGYPALACATLTAVPTGAAPYNYVWSNGATTASITVCNTVTTVYTVTVTDVNGCTSTDNVTVNVTDVRCGNGGRKVMVCHVPKGNPAGAHTICISSRAVAAHLAHGDHLGDCNQPPPNPCSNAPVVNLVADSIPDSLGCRNITGNVNGGTPPYSYAWNTGSTVQTIYVCNSVSTLYTLTVMDANGCISSDTITVVPPTTCSVNLGNDTTLCSTSPLVLHAGPGFVYMWSDSTTADTLSVTQSGTYWVQVSNASTGCVASDTITVLIFNPPVVSAVADSLPDSLGCRNITGTVSGGTPPYAYSWSTGDTLQIIHVCDSLATTYTLTVTDSNGCSGSASVTVGQPNPCLVNLGIDTSVCSTGPFVLHAGQGFITYLWSDSSTADTLAVTQSGTYWVQVSDSSTGCITSDTIAIVFFNAPVVTAFADSLADSLGCRNINALVSGGTIPFTYSWSTGASTVTIHVCDTVTTTYTVTVTDLNGCSSTDSVQVIPTCFVDLGADVTLCSVDSLVLDAGAGFTSYLWSDSSTARTLTVTTSGTYWVRATDTVFACTVSDTIEVHLFDSPVASAVADSLPDSLGCRNITASATGGTPPYHFSWSTGDSTAVIHVCDSIMMTYVVTVVDSNGCSSTDSATVIPPCEVNLGPDVSICAGDSVVLDAKIGQSFLWSDSSDAQTLTVTQSGTYWVQATDTVTGCTASDTIEVIVFVSPVVSVVADSLPDSLGCRNITGSVTGGTPPFTYSWSNGDSTAVIHVCDTVTMTYVLTVVDSNTCSSRDSVTVIPPCEVNLGADTSICSGDTLVLDAGTEFHSFVWSDSTTAQTLAVTQSGTYWIQATDTTTGCMATDTIEVIVFNSPVALAVADTIPDSLGCVNITGSFTGGTAPFTYSWSSSDTSFSDTSLVINVCDSLTITYMFTVIDSNGCSSTASVILNDTGSRPIQIAGRGVISIRPNPFMDYARIYYVVPESGRVTVELFDLNGKRIAVLFQGNAEQDIPYSLDFTRGDLIEALYIVRLTKADGSTLNSKMVLFKY